MANQTTTRAGRPPRTSLDALIDAAISLGLDTFTLAGVAAQVGVAESTVYNYVSGRESLYSKAAAAVFERLDIEVETEHWHEYVEEITERSLALAAGHPGLRQYLFSGPYEDSTVALYRAMVARIQGWFPELSEDLAFVLVSRPVVLSLATLGDPFFEPLGGWLRRSLLLGMDEQLRAGTPPPPAPISWRSKLVRSADVLPRAENGA